MTKTLSLAVLLSASVLASCGTNPVQVITEPIAASRIKFFNFGVSAPGVNFYAGSAKITAISSTNNTESTTGTAQGGVGLGGFYSSMAAGAYDFTAKIAAATDKDLVISTVNTTLADGKLYSFYTSGIYSATAKSVESFVIEDPVPAEFDFTQAYIRFVNAISNSQPMVLYAKSTVTGTEGPVGAAIAYKSGGAFIAVPGGVYDLSARAVGGSANLIVRAAVSFSAGKVYTIGARGDMTVVSTTSANRPQLDNTANR